MSILNGKMGAAVLIAASIAPMAQAEVAWTGRGEAGAVIASGNTDTKAGNAKLRLGHQHDEWSQQYNFAAVYASNDLGTTAQRWEAQAQTAYQFDQRNFSFGNLRYESDRFSGFRYQGTASAGVGHKFSDTPDYLFTAQIGAGYKFFGRRAVYSPLGVLLRPDDSGNAIAAIGNVDYKRSLNPSTSITERFTLEYTADNTYIQNEIALQVKMTDTLALALGYAVRYNTDPPPSFGKTDSLTTANIVYEFK